MDEDDAKTRYVIVDYQMVYPYSEFRGKFFAPTQFYDESNVSVSEYTNRLYFNVERSLQENRRPPNIRLQTQKYYESQAVRLYKFHGSAVEPQPYVVDWDAQQVQGYSFPSIDQAGNRGAVTRFGSMERAREYTENDSTSRIGGFGGNPSERVSALEHYRLVGASEQQASTHRMYDAGALRTAQKLIGPAAFTAVQNPDECSTGVTGRSVNTQNGTRYPCLSEGAMDAIEPTEPRWTKTFERVPGGTIEGTGPENATVRAAVQMKMPGSNETFVYKQRTETGPDGGFSMTVPYSTTGYDEWGPEQGHTNVSVRANSSYQLDAIEEVNGTNRVVAFGSTDVTEGQVIGENTSASTVELQPVQTIDPDDSSGGNETDGS